MNGTASNGACARFCGAMWSCFPKASISSCIRGALSLRSNLRNSKRRLCVFFIRHGLRRAACLRKRPLYDAHSAGHSRFLQTLAFAGDPFAPAWWLPLRSHVLRVCGSGHCDPRPVARHWPGDLQAAALPSLCARRARSGSTGSPGKTFPTRTVTTPRTVTIRHAAARRPLASGAWHQAQTTRK
jgi:hypothetical protein